MKLTKQGEILYRYAEAILRLAQSAEKEIVTLDRSLQGELQIGASTTIGEAVLPYLLGSFKKSFPQVSLLMQIGNSKSVIDKLLDESIHVGFVEAPMTHPMLTSRPFLEDELVAIASASHPHPLLAGKDHLTPQDLYTVPLILREPGSGTRQVLHESLRSVGMSPENLNIALELGNTEAVKASVETGLGISILSKNAIRKELQLGSLQSIRIIGMNTRRYFYVVHASNRKLPPPAYAFMDEVTAGPKDRATESSRRR